MVQSSFVSCRYRKVRSKSDSKHLAHALLLLLDDHPRLMGHAVSGREPLVTPVVGDHDIDGLRQDLVDAEVLLAAAFHVSGLHLLGDAHALLARDGRESLGFEEVDAGSFVAEIRLEADEDERGVGAEMQDFRVPLEVGLVLLGGSD